MEEIPGQEGFVILTYTIWDMISIVVLTVLLTVFAWSELIDWWSR